MTIDIVSENSIQANSDDEPIIRQAAPIRCYACECLVGAEDSSCMQCGALLVSEGWCITAQERQKEQ